MWLQMVSLAAAISAVRGMCFGVPLLQQTMPCPDTMIYYSPLCICIEPQHTNRLHEVGPLRKVPTYENTYADPSQTFKNKLDALRHRMTASLPDMSYHGYGSSAGDVRTPPMIFPDRLGLPSSSHDSMLNHLPQSWTIGGLLEAFSHTPSAIPTVNTGGNFSPSAAAWAKQGVDDISTLTLLERLHMLRSLWRDSTLRQAQAGLEDMAMAQAFLKSLPLTGINPDTGRSTFQHAGTPDGGLSILGSASQKPEKDTNKSPIHALKEAALAKQGLSDILPKDPSSRTNSFLRSASRLSSAARSNV